MDKKKAIMLTSIIVTGVVGAYLVTRYLYFREQDKLKNV